MSLFFLSGNPLMNDAQLSQTAGKAKTRQPGRELIVLNNYVHHQKKGCIRRSRA